VTALVRRIRLVRAAAAARMIAGAESRNSARWCSPMPNTSSPTSSATSTSSRRSAMRSVVDGSLPVAGSGRIAAKLSTPISITPPCNVSSAAGRNARWIRRQRDELGLTSDLGKAPLPPVVLRLFDPVLGARDEVPVDVARLGKGFSAYHHQMGAAARLQHDLGTGLEDHELRFAEDSRLAL